MTDPDLFNYQPRHYPDRPGFKARGTSQEAARKISSAADTLRERVLVELSSADLTPDECARRMGETVLAVRPRFTELSLQGAIARTGERRKNTSGMSANVWRRKRGFVTSE